MLLPAHGFQFTHSFLFQESKKLIPLSMDVYLYCFVFCFGRKFSLYYPPYFASSDILGTLPIFFTLTVNLTR